MDSLHSDAETMLKRYIYDYMVRKNFHASAREFENEAGVPIDRGEINDTPYGFLMEWWTIFWDIYVARLAKHGDEQAANYVSPLHQNNQERHSSEFMEIGSSSKEPWPQTQLLQSTVSPLHQNNQERHNSEFMEIGSSSTEPWPQTELLQSTVISQKSPSVNFPDNSFLRDSPIDQQIKPECHSANRFVCLDENWIKQSNFFKSAKPNVQPLRNEREPSNLASSVNTTMHHAEVKSSQQMKFGQPRLDSSLSVEPNATQQKLSGFPLPANGIILNEDRNKPRIGASSGVGSTSMNRQLDELLSFTNQHQYSMEGFHAQSLGSYLQAQPVNISNQIPLFIQMDKQKVVETIDNENQRKRKEPSYSGSEKSFGNREVAGPSMLSCFNPVSSLKEEWASQTLRKGHEEAKLPEIIKPLGVSGCLKEGSETKEAECQPRSIAANNKSSLKDFNAEDRGEIYSSTTQQYSLDVNRNDKHDQSKLSWATMTATEGPVPIAHFMNQQFKQNVSIDGGTSAENMKSSSERHFRSERQEIKRSKLLKLRDNKSCSRS